MSYLDQLQQYISDYILQIDKPSTFQGKDIDEAIDIIVSASISRLDLDKYLFVNESLATDRDIKLLCVLLGRQKICEHKKSVENFATEEYFFDIEDLIANRNLKYIRKYCVVYVKKGPMNVEFPAFCSNARLLLLFKYFQLRTDAQYKRHSLCWMGIKTVPPTRFQIEDYWHYEQETGINLSIEIAASLDELFQKYRGNLQIDNVDTQNFIVDILCECIKWNYCFIAAIPIIDFKIAAMKAACTYFAQSFIDSFHGLHDANPITKAFINLLEIHQKGFCADENTVVIEKTMLLVLFRLFNQFLCHFFSDPSGNSHIFNCADTWEDIPYWIRCKINHCRYFREKVDMSSKLRDFLLSTEHFSEFADGNEDEFYTKFIKQIKVYEDEVNQLYPRISNKGDLLIFCNEQNKLVKGYIDELTAGIYNICGKNCSKKSLCKALPEIIQSSKLAQVSASRSTRAQRFTKIQAAIEAAIKCSKK